MKHITRYRSKPQHNKSIQNKHEQANGKENYFQDTEWCKLHGWPYFHDKNIGDNIVGAHYYDYDIDNDKRNAITMRDNEKSWLHNKTEGL